MSLIEFALEYEKIGWSIVPVRPPEKPHSSGSDKVPYVKWKDCQSIRPVPQQLKEWYEKFPDARVGVITGKVSNMVTIDFDSPEAIEAFENIVCKLPETIYMETGRENGGKQYFFEYPEDTFLITKAGLIENVDLKAEGGFAVLPPSIHKSGKKYKWGKIDPLEHGLDDLLEMPQEILKFCLSPPSTTDKKIVEHSDSKKSKNRPGWVNDLLWGVKEGMRNVSAAKLAGYFLRIFNGDKEQTLTAMTGWNSRNNPPLTEKRLNLTVDSIASRCGMDKLSSVIGKHVYQMEIMRYPDSEVMYRVYIEDQNTHFQITPKDFVSPRSFRPKLMALTRKVMRPIDEKTWFPIIEEALQEATELEMTEDETVISTIKGLIKDDIRRGEYEEPEKFIDNAVIIEHGIIHVYLDVVIKRMRFLGIKVNTKKELGTMMRILGFSNKLWRTKDGGVVRTWQAKCEKIFAKSEIDPSKLQIL